MKRNEIFASGSVTMIAWVVAAHFRARKALRQLGRSVTKVDD